MIVQGIYPRNAGDLAVEMVRLGVPQESLEKFTSGGMFKVIRISGLKRVEALALKDTMVSSGGDAALPLSSYKGGLKESDLILMGTHRAYGDFIGNSASANPELAGIIDEVRNTLMRVDGAISPDPVMWPDGQMNFGQATYVMGIVNRTPDSFYDGGVNYDESEALETVRRMLEAGADIIDVGGESTRPGADEVPLDEEILRTAPFIRLVKKEFPEARISIDTYKAEVAEKAIEAGAGMINDVSAFGFDPNMARVAAASGLPVCIMHIQGTPKNMQANPVYPNDVCYEINTFFRDRISAAVEAGVKESQIIIDPGLGFGKTVEHNLEILSRLGEFKAHGRPLLIGASRKSFIGKTLNLDAEDRLEGSLAAAVLSVTGGADIVRVHDVKESVRAVRMADAVVRKMRMLNVSY